MSKHPKDLREFSVDVVRRLRRAGHAAYWAGGCVRDILLERIPKDFDVATSARPEEVQALFRRTVPIGAAFGVINVIGSAGMNVEVATFRSDGDYSDGRHPDSITYSTPQEDARRRDFTINGMFFDPIANNDSEALLDYVGGREDMTRRVIRAIGDPRDRFGEDKLRMLRAVRFAARFHYAIDPATMDAIGAMATEIRSVSPERILAELRSMLEDPSRRTALELLRASGLFANVLPELGDPLAEPSRWEQTLTMLGGWPQPIRLAKAMAALVATLTDADAKRACDGILRRLKSANDDREPALWLIDHRHSLDHARSLKASRIKRILAHPLRNALLDLIEATERAMTGSAPNTDHVRALQSNWTQHDIDPAPLVTGDDLVRLGYSPGPQFKAILDGVRDAQLDAEIDDADSAIRWLQTRWTP